jgi:cystathionine beta-lyase/cystathionine gamma-synthase
MKFATRAIRVGQQPDPATGSIAVPVYQAVNYVFDDIGRPHAYEYSRSANPTRTAFETCLASLEEATHALTFASGMAAIEAALSILRPGDRVVSARQIYGGTWRLFEDVCRPRGIEIDYVDGTRPEAFDAAVRPETKLIWIETPANPLLQLVDVRAVAAVARSRNLWLGADNTFASPYFQRPLTQGADIVVHSTTKYIGGHSDVVGGAVVVNDPDLYQRIRTHQNTVGAVPGPWDAWLSLRGLKTLAVRMKQHASNARIVADYLSVHPRVEELYYPGHPGHPQHDLARAQMDGFGAMVTLRLDGGLQRVRRFVKALNVFLFAESLGGVESLVCHPATMSHAAMNPDERARAGIADGVIRLSVGIEDPEDLVEDLGRALDA